MSSLDVYNRLIAHGHDAPARRRNVVSTITQQQAPTTAEKNLDRTKTLNPPPHASMKNRSQDHINLFNLFNIPTTTFITAPSKAPAAAKRRRLDDSSSDEDDVRAR